MRSLGFGLVGNAPGKLAAQLRAEGAKWARVTQGAGIKPR
jgi:hypothetical protein